MTDEAVLVSEHSALNPVQRTIANGSSGTDIEKHTLMKLEDENTVDSSDGVNEWGGILATEKVGGDGSTTIGCHMNGQWDLRTHIGAAISIGEQVTLSGANLIRAATAAEVQLGKFIGNADAVAADGTAETILVTLRGG